MSDMVEKVYSAASSSEQKRLYDNWSENYEQDLFAMGYRSPLVAASVFARFVDIETAPILDAGCGGGLQCEPLAAMGYRDITGIDLSDGMLAVARSKGIYAALENMALGGGLDLPANTFAATISVGTITPGHAPPSCFHDLIEVCRPGAKIVFTLRSDAGMVPDYWQECQRLQSAGAWTWRFSTAEFVAMPFGEADVLSRVHVFETA